MTLSADLFAKAQTLIPGGVNSPVRACRSVGCDPLFIASAAGSKMTTVEGREMLDYVMSWGPMLLGHKDPDVTAAIRSAVEAGVSYGAPCPGEVALAEAVVDAVPGIDMVRMVNSGTEATMSAVRLARGYTGKSMIVKFEGCYHGHSDAFLAAAGSGLATFCIPGTPGVPADTVRHTLLAPYNDLDAVKALFETRPDIAAVIVEPVAGNMGLVLPKPGFLEGLRELTAAHGALLIFDEVITGFRLAYGGAQSVFGIDPDLTCLGKIIGGGLPVGAYGGKRHIMERIAPCGDVYQAGTLSGNPLAMAAGLATLTKLKASDYDALAERTKALAEEMAAILRDKGAPVTLTRIASLFTLFFCDGPVTNFDEAKKGDAARYASFYNQMREAGVILAPSAYECAFTSFAHSEDDYARTLDAVRSVKF
ncbi:glutamate-1-semialdehyde 2,1-aminomutase [Solidesulfovibrio magneticus]|uniref:Glutamate-1-semialdehyde 2,1-aminomutase n=1 Tax=Solidesulfovibrio magneticus (strain ATCC 700980 / DSM 13731 / RS-1) TaxID=573370 RepID=C4XGD3_SOLM1|nr:glutamate-1-semialdehyde 2,1-aminomutase [Solidesulfovibrio magneticus]BAH73713.1 glutamate-1-semialdehyde 2,1-aminomutase [Solidesulfovibrio magneticus RS-1]